MGDDISKEKEEELSVVETCPNCHRPIKQSTQSNSSETPSEKTDYCLCDKNNTSESLISASNNKLEATRPKTFQVEPNLPDKFEILELIGQGGMGTVWKVRDKELNKILALKALKPELTSDKQFVKRFEQEAQSTSGLDHPNLVSVYSLDSDASSSNYLVMDYIPGKNLSELIASEGKLELKRFLNIAKQIADALKYAHSKGIIHRDLKPSNIIVSDGPDGDKVKVVDFGIAKVMPSVSEQTNNLTTTGEFIGSPYYMSTEQCLGDELDARSDIYSLGCVLFELLVGNPPFDSTNPIKVILAHVNEEPKLDELYRLKIPNPIITLIASCLEKKPEDRYESIEALIKDLELARQGKKLKTLTTKNRKSRNLLVAMGAAFCICATICYATQLSFIHRAQASFNWPTTTGHITSSKIRYSKRLNGTDNLRGGGKLDIKYLYKVRGREYLSNQFQIFGPIPPNVALEKIAQEYKTDTDTIVYYNPKNPRDACLKPGCSIKDPKDLAAKTSGGLFLIGAIFAFLGLSGWFVYLLPATQAFEKYHPYTNLYQKTDTPYNKKPPLAAQIGIFIFLISILTLFFLTIL